MKIPEEQNYRFADVLVTQAWGRIAYNIVRSLGKHGLKIVVGSDRFRGMSLLSRYTHTSFRHPVFATHPLEFVTAVKEALVRYRPKVYMPSDQDAFLIARYKDLFEDLDVNIPIAPFNTLMRLHKKNESTNLANSLNIPTPDTIIPKNSKDVIDSAERWGFPIVFKRLSSSAGRGVFYGTPDSLPLILKDDLLFGQLRYGDFLVQRYIKGVGYGVSMLFNRGQMRAKFTHKRLREIERTGGVSTLRTGVVNPLLEEYAETILKSVEYHGVAMVEFKYDEETREGYFIEVNPRFWGSLALAIQSGVDFPHLLYRIALEDDIESVLSYKTGLNVRWILGDVRAILGDLKRNAGLHKADKITGRIHGYDDLYQDDPLPFLGEIFFGIMKRARTRGRTTGEGDLPAGLTQTGL